MAVQVVLYLMKHIFDEDFGAHLEKGLQYLGKIGNEKTQLEFLEWMLRYAYSAREDNLHENIDRGLDALDNINARKVAMTIAERLKQEGRTEGIFEGEVKGRMMLIQKQLNKRFGGISPALEKRLKDSRPDVIDRFGESIFDFKDLADAERWWDRHSVGGNA